MSNNMDNLCNNAISAYINTLNKHFECVQTETGCLLITPFLRSDNEYIEIELIVQPSGDIVLTDNADAIAFLETHGLNINRSRDMKRQLVSIQRRFNVNIENDEIYITTNMDSLGESIDALVNTIQDVSYLIYKKIRRGVVSFYDEVEKFLIKNEVRYDPQFPVQGASSLHAFRFHLNGTRNKLLEPLTATSPHSALDRAQKLAFRWVDVRDIRPVFNKVAVLDNTAKRESIWEGTPTNILKEYSDKVVLWSNQEELLNTVTH